jgi:hypothetical protein
VTPIDALEQKMREYTTTDEYTSAPDKMKLKFMYSVVRTWDVHREVGLPKQLSPPVCLHLCHGAKETEKECKWLVLSSRSTRLEYAINTTVIITFIDLSFVAIL